MISEVSTTKMLQQLKKFKKANEQEAAAEAAEQEAAAKAAEQEAVDKAADAVCTKAGPRCPEVLRYYCSHFSFKPMAKTYRVGEKSLPFRN